MISSFPELDPSLRVRPGFGQGVPDRVQHHEEQGQLEGALKNRCEDQEVGDTGQNLQTLDNTIRTEQKDGPDGLKTL